MGKLFGLNELTWRRHHEREAVALADDGAAAPLCSATPPWRKQDDDGQRYPQQHWGRLYGTERLEPGQVGATSYALPWRCSTFRTRAGRGSGSGSGRCTHMSLSGSNLGMWVVEVW